MGGIFCCLPAGVPLFPPFISFLLFRFPSAKGEEEEKVMSHFMILSALHRLFSGGESFASFLPTALSSQIPSFSFSGPRCMHKLLRWGSQAEHKRRNTPPAGWSLGEVPIYSEVTYRKGHLWVQLSTHGLKLGRMGPVGQSWISSGNYSAVPVGMCAAVSRCCIL